MGSRSREVPGEQTDQTFADIPEGYSVAVMLLVCLLLWGPVVPGATHDDFGDELAAGRVLGATKAVVITTGTFLNGLIHISEATYPSGSGEPASKLLGESAESTIKSLRAAHEQQRKTIAVYQAERGELMRLRHFHAAVGRHVTGHSGDMALNIKEEITELYNNLHYVEGL